MKKSPKGDLKMKHYETIYIINPNMADDDYSDAIEKFNKLIEKQKGVIVKSQEWGRQRLAYDIKKFDKGFYVLIDYCADAGVTAFLERALKLDDRVLKYQTVKLADRADPQELIRKEQAAKKESDQERDDILPPEQAVQKETLAADREVNDGV